MNYYDVQNFACAVLGLNYDTLVDNLDENKIDKALYEKFNISIEQFNDIVEALLPFTPAIKAGPSGEKYHAFINKKRHCILVKKPA